MKKNKFCIIFSMLIVFLAYGIQTVESQDDYSYVPGVWEQIARIAGGTFIIEITVKEILAAENRAIVFAKWPDYNAGKNFIAAGTYEVNDAQFKPGSEPVIEYKNPVTGRDMTLKFNKNGTGTVKAVSTSGGASGTIFADLKKIK